MWFGEIKERFIKKATLKLLSKMAKIWKFRKGLAGGNNISNATQACCVHGTVVWPYGRVYRERIHNTGMS